MTNARIPPGPSSALRGFLEDLQLLSVQPVSVKYHQHVLPEYPFDPQLLNASPLYRRSRQLYVQLGGRFHPRLASMMRSLSAQDLFADDIEYSPSFSEIIWFLNHHAELADGAAEMKSLAHFNEIAVFHEQNHRILWRLLPPAPTDERGVSRYLNFAEALVVTLDLALGDQLGKKLSPVFERQHVIYRTGGEHSWQEKGAAVYQNYLMAIWVSTYYILELINPEDILAAVNYVLPGQKKMNAQALKRSSDIDELFTRVTNPQWQSRFWKDSSAKLKHLHKGRHDAPLELPRDPLDLEVAFPIALRIFNHFGL
jgi:hypothetical protein